MLLNLKSFKQELDDFLYYEIISIFLKIPTKYIYLCVCVSCVCVKINQKFDALLNFDIKYSLYNVWFI